MVDDKKTIGFIVSGIMDEFTEQLCKGILSESKNDNIRLVIIPVKYIYRDMKDCPDPYEYQYETNALNITAESFDALIISADCIGCLTTEDNILKFVDNIKAKNIPIILAASNIDGYPGVIFDNKTGIIEAMDYLVKELGIKKICMLRSAENNSDVTERYYTFRERMWYYGLPVRPESVVTTHLYDNCREACEQILDDNPDMEAIFCANDAVALEFYKLMNERGLIPGRDIKVMGFDNSINGSMITPSLTTVDADAVQLGSRAFSMLRMVMEGWDVGIMTIPTHFILRDSFGLLLDKENSDEDIFDKSSLDEYFDRIFFMFDRFSDKSDLEIPILFKALMTVIIDYINDKEYNPERTMFLKGKVDEFFRTGALKYTDVNLLISYTERVKDACINKFADNKRKCQVYETFSQILEKISTSTGKNPTIYIDIKDNTLFSVKDMMEEVFSFDVPSDEQYACIVKNMTEYGVKNAYVYIYEEPLTHLQGEELTLPDKVRIKIAMNNEDIQCIPEEDQVIELIHLFDNDFVKADNFNMVLMPLYFRDKLYGSLLYDLTDTTYRNGDFLVSNYSSAARAIHMFKNSAIK